MVKVVRRREADGAAGVQAGARQPFLYPPDTFISEQGDSLRFWSCVRTRPRWEKKFAAWLVTQRMRHFLPVLPHETFSGRKRRVTHVPLFPGYVFVEGNHGKGDFDRTGIVVYVLKPRWPHEEVQLHRELWNVWRGLVGGLYVTPIHTLAAGERCRIVRGALQGVEARFERMGRSGRIVLQVEMMGGGLAAEVAIEDIEVA